LGDDVRGMYRLNTTPKVGLVVEVDDLRNNETNDLICTENYE
jgi:hypothetical protein